MNFKKVAIAIETQFNKLSKHDLFITNVDKDTIWDTYLESFPEGTNPIYLERTEHDCQCCKSFLRNAANIVAIINNKLVSLWDIQVDDEYQIVMDALAKLVKEAPIKTVFFHHENQLGQEYTNQLLENQSIKRWNHFNYKLPDKFVSNDIDTKRSNINSGIDVFKRGLEELTLDALETVKELIDTKELYKGDEYKNKVNEFLNLKKEYEKTTDKELFIWQNYRSPVVRFRNSVIGTLITDLSEGKLLEHTLNAYNKKTDPTKFQRSQAKTLTESQKKKALQFVSENVLEASLPRRAANTEDINIHDVIFADRSTAQHMQGSIGDILSSVPSTTSKPNTQILDITIEDFIKDVVPKVNSIEMLLENKHQTNLMSLIAPLNKDTKSLFKWNNNFSWSYNGNITDSMSTQVEALGGRTDGVFRFTHSW
ncbi:MAG: hypothetical protein KAI79_16045, partial [Bacteroidales bacterium]|nr:hypothetical protein [Bacteroidales bacterium]